MDHRRPGPLEKWPAAPENDRRCQRQLHPVHRRHAQQVVQRLARQHVAHRQEEDGQAQGEADPEAAAHIRQFRVRSFLQTDGARLKSHAANGAGTRLVAHDLRVHGAGIDSPARDWRRRGGWQLFRCELGRVRLELLHASLRAEVVGPLAVSDRARGASGVHGHAANRVDGGVGSAVFLDVNVCCLGVHSHSLRFQLWPTSRAAKRVPLAGRAKPAGCASRSRQLVVGGTGFQPVFWVAPASSRCSGWHRKARWSRLPLTVCMLTSFHSRNGSDPAFSRSLYRIEGTEHFGGARATVRSRLKGATNPHSGCTRRPTLPAEHPQDYASLPFH